MSDFQSKAFLGICPDYSHTAVMSCVLKLVKLVLWIFPKYPTWNTDSDDCCWVFFRVPRAMEGTSTPALRSHELGYTRAAFLEDFQLNAIHTPVSKHTRMGWQVLLYMTPQRKGHLFPCFLASLQVEAEMWDATYNLIDFRCTPIVCSYGFVHSFVYCFLDYFQLSARVCLPVPDWSPVFDRLCLQ